MQSTLMKNKTSSLAHVRLNINADNKWVIVMSTEQIGFFPIDDVV